MGNKCKILIVEDERITRQALRYILKEQGDFYEIVGEASNGRDAQVIIEQERPHIVLTDIQMPVMDGIELSKWIQLKYPETYIVVLSSYSSFEYVKPSFQYGVFEYILKPQLEPEILFKILQRIRVKLNLVRCSEERKSDSIILNGYLDRELTGEVTILQKSINIKKGFFIAIGCQIDKIIGYKKANEQLYYETILNYWQEELGEWLIESIHTSEKQIIALINIDEVELELWEDKEVAFSQKFSETMSGLKIACSDIAESEQELLKQIQVIKNLTGKQFFIEDSEKIYYSIKNLENRKISFSQSTYRSKLESGLYKEAFKLLKEFTQCKDLKYYYSEDEFKKIVEYSIYTTLNYIEESKLDKVYMEIGKLQILNMIVNMHSINDLNQYLDKIFIDLYELIHKGSPRDQKIMIKIYQYIDIHFREQLTLQQVANVFHMSYSYLSTYFSHAANKGFNEYLNMRRVDEAKKLLQYSDIPIACIGEKVGYMDQSYFSKVFKKIVGKSPSSYRRDKMNKDDV